MEKELMTPKEVAAMCRVEVRTVRRWVQLKRLPALRVGHTVRFRREAVLLAMEISESEVGSGGHDSAMW